MTGPNRATKNPCGRRLRIGMRDAPTYRLFMGTVSARYWDAWGAR